MSKIMNIGEIYQSGRIFQRIEHDEDSTNHELPQQIFIAKLNVANSIKRRDNIEIEISNQSSIDEWKIFILDCRLEIRHVFLNRFDGRSIERFHQISLFDHQFIFENLKSDEWFCAEKCVSPETLLSCINRFEHESLALADQFVINRDGSVEIR